MPMSAAAPVVTISTPLGTGGGIIAAAVAAKLGVPLIDRAIPASVAMGMAVPIDEALAHDERVESRISRLLTGFANSGLDFVPPIPPVVSERSFREETERVIRDTVSEGRGCVIVGRAGAIVLREHPGALFVRLRGSFEARARQVIAARSDLDEADARRRLSETDRNHAAYFRHFYNADPADPRLYHLVIDSTALGNDATTDLILVAARGGANAATAQPEPPDV